MKARFVGSLLTIASAFFLALPAHAQAPAAAPKTAPKVPAAVKSTPAIPRTADGHPDLTGVYSNVTTVPMTRPANCKEKEFYTEEDIKNGEGGARGCQTAEEAAAAAANGRGGRGGRGGGGRGAAANIDPETGQPALAVHYDTAQFGLSGNTMVRSSSLRTSIITGPEGKLPATVPDLAERQKAIAAARGHQWDGPETRPLGERCITWPSEGPPMMSAGYNADVQIVQGDGFVGIEQEMIHDTRMIATSNDPPALPSDVHQWFGSSRGHWEGDKLVIVTTNYSGKTSIQNTPVTDKTKVTEKFSRLDADHVLYEFTVEDPLTWSKPWSGEVVWTKINEPIYEYACQEGNYGMANNLSGERAAEAKAAQQK